MDNNDGKNLYDEMLEIFKNKGYNVDEFVESLRKVLDGQVDKREAGYRVAQSRSIDDVAYQLVEAYRKVLEM